MMNPLHFFGVVARGDSASTMLAALVAVPTIAAGLLPVTQSWSQASISSVQLS